MVELAEKRSNRQFAPHVAIIYLQWAGATLYLNTPGTTKPYFDRRGTAKWIIFHKDGAISGLTLLIPFITGVITHLLSGMSHQVLTQLVTHCYRFHQSGRFSDNSPTGKLLLSKPAIWGWFPCTFTIMKQWRHDVRSWSNSSRCYGKKTKWS